jgi:hypothetical protein
MLVPVKKSECKFLIFPLPSIVHGEELILLLLALKVAKLREIVLLKSQAYGICPHKCHGYSLRQCKMVKKKKRNYANNIFKQVHHGGI